MAEILVCVGGDKFEVKAKRVGKGFTAAVVAGKVEDMGDGVYRALCVPNFTGTYEIHVTSKGAQLSHNHAVYTRKPYDAQALGPPAGAGRARGPTLRV